MPRFLCLQRPLSEPLDVGVEPAGPDAFAAWLAANDDYIADIGGPFVSSVVSTLEGSEELPSVMDFAGGYMVLVADSHPEAVRIANECPGLVSSRSGVEVVEIREV